MLRVPFPGEEKALAVRTALQIAVATMEGEASLMCARTPLNNCARKKHFKCRPEDEKKGKFGQPKTSLQILVVVEGNTLASAVA